MYVDATSLLKTNISTAQSLLSHDCVCMAVQEALCRK